MIYFLSQIRICMAMFFFDGQVLFIYFHHEVTVLFTTMESRTVELKILW